MAWKSEQEYTFSVGPKENTATLAGLSPNTVYKVRLFAQNLLGKSLASDDLVIRTEDEGECGGGGERLPCVGERQVHSTHSSQLYR